MELHSIASALFANQTVTFRHGLAEGEPVLSAGDWRGVGIADLNQKITRVVQVGLPARTMDTLNARRPKNPLSRIGLGVVRRVLSNTAGTANELRFEGERCTIRSSGDGEWRDVSLPDAERARRLPNDPAWVLDLVSADHAAVRTYDEEDRGEQVQVEAKLDAAAVARLLPGELARSATDLQADDHFDDVALHILCRADRVPTSVAASWGTSNLTGEPQWNVIEIVAFDEGLDAPDLWASWQSLEAA